MKFRLLAFFSAYFFLKLGYMLRFL